MMLWPRRFCNTSSKFELFVPEVSAKLQLLSKSSLDSITATVQVRLYSKNFTNFRAQIILSNSVYSLFCYELHPYGTWVPRDRYSYCP